ncbi:peroxisomal nicotinamide adenine dinucleotide carrier-like [Hordeum vulgare]|nr:peroxisomal nicotinamide adenine dinucleotide carrier-like [Hordeum vulgare]
MSSAVVNGLAGAGGGIIAQIITYPLQTVNTWQQTERSAKKKKAGSGGSDASTLYQMLQLVQTEGWGGLYSGLKPSLIGTAASQGIYYYFYQFLKNISDDGLDIAYERLYRRISDRGCPTAVNDAERKQDLVGSSEMLVHVRGLLHPICHGGQICRRDLDPFEFCQIL